MFSYTAIKFQWQFAKLGLSSLVKKIGHMPPYQYKNHQ